MADDSNICTLDSLDERHQQEEKFAQLNRKQIYGWPNIVNLFHDLRLSTCIVTADWYDCPAVTNSACDKANTDIWTQNNLLRKCLPPLLYSNIDNFQQSTSSTWKQSENPEPIVTISIQAFKSNPIEV